MIATRSRDLDIELTNGEYTFTVSAASSVDAMLDALKDEIADADADGVEAEALPDLTPEGWSVSYECDLDGFELEGKDLETVAAVMHVVEAADSFVPLDAIAAVIDQEGTEYAASMVEDYQGYYADEAAFGAEYTDGLGDIPDYLQSYIDWEKFGRDLKMDFTIVDCPSGGFWAFRG